MALTVLNDLHIGVERIAGTTVDSRWRLRQNLIWEFSSMLMKGQDVMILGDLFDAYAIPIFDVLRTFDVLRQWLADNAKCTLYLVAGNHDLSKTSNVLSSFDLLGNLLWRFSPDQVEVIKEPKMTKWGYVIPHLPTQAEFDVALTQVPECDLLYLHVNYDNKFAMQSDNSLNLTPEQLEALPVKMVISGHEHNYRATSKIILPGNQVGSSVADWVSSPEKYKVKICNGLTPTVQLMQGRESYYVEMPWDNLEDIPRQFIRVVGEATAEQASQVVTAIAKLRAVSNAFVISNAVKIVSESGAAAFNDSLESVRAFDVWNALGDHLTDSELQTLKELE